MATVQVWSDGLQQDVEVPVTPELEEAVRDFLRDHEPPTGQDEGEMFSSNDLPDVFGELHETCDTGTVSLVNAFLPPGLGVTQHGWDDFAIEAVQEGVA